MFGRRKINIGMIIPTSKMSLKMTCLSACENDVERAGKLYEYIIEGIGDIPDFDPVRPTGLQQIKQSADELIGWVNGHQDDIARGISIVQSLRHPTTGASVAASVPMNDVPPIPNLK